jgi:hypothetical protein
VIEACKEFIGMKQLLQEFGIKQGIYVLFCDNNSAIYLAKNLIFHFRSKHIKLMYHWIQKLLDREILFLEKIHMNDNGANMLTKMSPSSKFEVCRQLTGLI